MRKIKTVKIDGFWEDKTVALKFNNNINFLIGVNGSGKTTIINLIAATLHADFATLDKVLFRKIRIDFFDTHSESSKGKSQTYIEVEKTEKENSPYSNIIFRIKTPEDASPKIFKLNELEEEGLFRYPKGYIIHKINQRSGQASETDIYLALKDFVNLTWLSIHRTSGRTRNNEDLSLESTIDQKIKEISIDLVKYFGILDRRYSLETEKFQKNIFLSLIEDEKDGNLLESDGLDSEKERESLRQIFLLFKLKENEFSQKLDTHFKNFENAINVLKKEQAITSKDFSYILGTRRIHSIVQEWNTLNKKKIDINKPKFTFIDEINNLFQRKKIFINERNELLIETHSGKIFPLINLSSGEKQLLIILGQSLLQENNNHIYIADEPELSLHVEWQEKLVSSIKNVNPNSQIIFATHSPDIVGKFNDSVIKVEDFVK